MKELLSNEILSMLLAAVVSVTIGYFSHFIVRMIKLFMRRKTSTSICGKWHSYDCWKDDSAVNYRSMTGKIKKGVLTEYRVKFVDDKSALKYGGSAAIESNRHLCIQMKAEDVLVETAVSRFNIKASEQREQLYGFWLSCDSHRNVFCGSALLSRRELAHEEIREILREKYETHMDTPLLVLND